jgi:energy-coupling factor transporter ATP-binding protein EcfA2
VKIISLRAENVKRLRAVEITPDGNTIVIAGRNGQGKSSVLDAIWMALAGAAGAKETSKPIRDGEDKASVDLDLGDLVVRRRWTEAGTTLEVTAPDGARYASPQTMLDSLIGRLTFDPLAFAQMDPRGQRAALLEVLDLKIDPDEIARRRQGVYDHRRDVNRDGKRLVAQIEGLPLVPDGTPDDEVSAAEIAAELASAEEAARDSAALEAAYATARQRVADLEAQLADAGRQVVEIAAAQKKLPEPVDPEPIRERLSAVDLVNANVRAKRDRNRLQVEATALREEWEKLTADIEAIDVERDEAIAAANMPVEGLSFDESGVIYNGVPFSQASSAEQLRVSVAVAMALNPKIRVIRITDGSLLDTENLALIEEMAGAHDFQVWIERVDETGTVGITIEDGQVVSSEVPA